MVISSLATTNAIDTALATNIVNAVKEVCEHDVSYADESGIIYASTNDSLVGKTTTSKDSVSVPFMYNDEFQANIIVSGKPEEVKRYINLAVRISTLILDKQDAASTVISNRAELDHFVCSLIHNDYINPTHYNHIMNKYSFNSDTNYTTVICSTTADYSSEYTIYKAFEEIGSKLYSSNFNGEHVILIESKKLSQWSYIFWRLVDTLPKNAKIGIGTPATLSNQYLSYRDAEIAISSLLGDSHIAYYDELNIELLFGTISPDMKNRFIQKNLGNLDDSDKHILRVYFSNDMSLKDTCEKLFIHKNTLQYQLDRIHKRSGYNPRVFKDAADLYIALKLESTNASLVNKAAS